MIHSSTVRSRLDHFIARTPTLRNSLGYNTPNFGAFDTACILHAAPRTSHWKFLYIDTAKSTMEHLEGYARLCTAYEDGYLHLTEYVGSTDAVRASVKVEEMDAFCSFQDRASTYVLSGKKTQQRHPRLVCKVARLHCYSQLSRRFELGLRPFHRRHCYPYLITLKNIKISVPHTWWADVDAYPAVVSWQADRSAQVRIDVSCNGNPHKTIFKRYGKACMLLPNFLHVICPHCKWC